MTATQSATRPRRLLRRLALIVMVVLAVILVSVDRDPLTLVVAAVAFAIGLAIRPPANADSALAWPARRLPSQKPTQTPASYQIGPSRPRRPRRLAFWLARRADSPADPGRGERRVRPVSAAGKRHGEGRLAFLCRDRPDAGHGGAGWRERGDLVAASRLGAGNTADL